MIWFLGISLNPSVTVWPKIAGRMMEIARYPKISE
jgi:hypothetical protein